MNAKKKLVVLISYGMDDERASVAWSIANGGIKSGLDVNIFLVSAGVDWVRKGAADKYPRMCRLQRRKLVRLTEAILIKI